MLFVEVHQIRRDNVNTVCLVACTKTDDRHWQRFGQVLTNFFAGDFAHDGETTRVDHGPGIVYQFLGTISFFTLGEETTEWLGQSSEGSTIPCGTQDTQCRRRHHGDEEATRTTSDKARLRKYGFQVGSRHKETKQNRWPEMQKNEIMSTLQAKRR